MVIVVGIILLALGICLAVAWLPQFLMALQGIVALTLLAWGCIAILVGYSEMKARREYSAAIRENESLSREPANETSAVDSPLS